MLKLKKTTQKPVINFLLSVLTAIIVFVVLLSFSALALLKININKELLYLFLYSISGISVFVSGMFFSNISLNKRLLKGLISVFTVTFIIFIALLIFNNYYFSLKLMLIIPVSIIFGFFGCVAGINLKRK